jgi:hypothetical protein
MQRQKHTGWRRLAALLALAVLLLAALPVATPAQAIPSLVYYPQTGHFLGGAFRAFFDANGGVGRFGYPVTDEFTRESDGTVVQYFERARFELAIGPGQTPIVRLGSIGVDYTQMRDYRFERVPPVPDTPDRRYFPETGHTLEGAFKAYWDATNGGFYYGPPISQPVNEVINGRQFTVQFFERARLEIHSDRIRVGLLGRVVAPCQQQIPRPQDLPPSGPVPEGDPRSCDNPASMPIGTVFPAEALPGTLFGVRAINFDDNEEVSLWLNLPDGSVRRIPYKAKTDANGYFAIGFETRPDAQLGNWSVVAQGVESRRKVVLPFLLIR